MYFVCSGGCSDFSYIFIVRMSLQTYDLYILLSHCVLLAQGCVHGARMWFSLYLRLWLSSAYPRMFWHFGCDRKLHWHSQPMYVLAIVLCHWCCLLNSICCVNRSISSVLDIFSHYLLLLTFFFHIFATCRCSGVPRVHHLFSCRRHQYNC